MTSSKFEKKEKENKVDAPYFGTCGWEQNYSGAHPVEMLARIARFESVKTNKKQSLSHIGNPSTERK